MELEKRMRFVGLLIGGVIGALIACTNSVTKEVTVNDPLVKPVQVKEIEVKEISNKNVLNGEKLLEVLKEDFKEDKWNYVVRDDDYNMFVIDLVAKDDSGKIKLYFYEDKIYSTIEYYYTTKDGRDWINRDSQECYADEKLYNDVYNGDVNIVNYIHDNSEDF